MPVLLESKEGIYNSQYFVVEEIYDDSDLSNGDLIFLVDFSDDEGKPLVLEYVGVWGMVQSSITLNVRPDLPEETTEEETTTEEEIESAAEILNKIARELKNRMK